MILVDTSVWVDHFRKGNSRLSSLLDTDQVLCHPFVVGELACGHLRNRGEILGLLRTLPAAYVVSDDETLDFLESHGLHGRGLGWVDVHLLCSAWRTRCDLWTLDRAMRSSEDTLRRTS